MTSLKSNFYVFVLSVFFVVLSATNLYAEQESRLALLIGNSNYKYSGKLPNPINDVRAIKIVLEQLGFTVLKYEDCSQNTMKRAIDKFGKQLKTKDVGLFFYAGHGVQVDGYNYLVPINAKLENENDAEYDCVRAGRILAKMESAGSRTNIVILDACRANPFERAWRRGEKGSGLAFMNAPSGSLIAYSTAPGKTALDGSGENSPYTRALLQHIDKPDITIIQMFQRVRSIVMKQSDKKQIPWESTSLRGDFYFKGGVGIKIYKQSLEKDIITEPPKPDETKKAIQAIKDISEQINLNPKDASAYRNRASAYVFLQQYTKAIPDLTKAIELEPNNATAYGKLGTVYARLEQYTKAMQNYTKAIKLDPNDWLSYNNIGARHASLNQPIKAIESFDKAIEAHLKQTSITIIHKTDKSITLDPNYALPYINLGDVYASLKQYRKAIHNYKEAIGWVPENMFAYYKMGLSYAKLKQHSKAIENFGKAIELDPLYKHAYFNRGFAYSKLKQYTKAIQDYTKTIDLDPLTPFLYFCRGFAYSELKQYTQAIQDYTKAIELDPLYTQTYFYRGIAYKELKQYTKAIQDFTQLLDLDPKERNAYSNRGFCYLVLERYSQGCIDAKKACEMGDCKLLEFLKEDKDIYNCE
jgi:tetratricopeptide (TPR) repeat protein